MITSGIQSTSGGERTSCMYGWTTPNQKQVLQSPASLIRSSDIQLLLCHALPRPFGFHPCAVFYIVSLMSGNSSVHVLLTVLLSCMYITVYPRPPCRYSLMFLTPTLAEPVLTTITSYVTDVCLHISPLLSSSLVLPLCMGACTPTLNLSIRLPSAIALLS